MRTRMLLFGVLLVSLTALQGCSPVPVETVKTVTIHTPVIVPVPKAYTAPIIVPKLVQQPTNADLAHYILVLRQVIGEYSARMQKIAGLAKKHG